MSEGLLIPVAEQIRRCEVRDVCAKGAAGKAYLALVEVRRGKAAADALRTAAREQYALGSRGKWGDWRV